MTTTAHTLFAPLTIATAPEEAKPVLENIQKSFGFIPNLMAIFANDPAVLRGYLALDQAFEAGSFTAIERQIILLTASVENDCNYCAAAHATIAKGVLHAPADEIAAIRAGVAVPNSKINALVDLVRQLVRGRGNADPKTVEEFLAAGYRKEQIMEILLGLALKTISNYLDHISPTPIDSAFEAESRQSAAHSLR